MVMTIEEKEKVFIHLFEKQFMPELCMRVNEFATVLVQNAFREQGYGYIMPSIKIKPPMLNLAQVEQDLLNNLLTLLKQEDLK